MTDMTMGDRLVRADSGAGWMFFVSATLILIATIGQKIALPGTGNALAISTAALPTITALAWVTGRLRVDRGILGMLLLFLAAAMVSAALNSATDKVSLSSLMLVMLIHLPLALRPPRDDVVYVRSVCFYRDLMFWLSLAGVAQFLLQGVIGRELAFFVDHATPRHMYLDYYNNLNPVSYGSAYFKSNGIFFAEPSFFSQFVAIAAIIELLTRQRPVRLAGFGAALICAYSGTGIMTILLFGAVWMLRHGGLGYVLGAIAVAGLIIAFGSVLQIDAITNRLTEFSTPNSSGHARFISIFYLLDHVTFDSFQSALFGKGPGTITSYYADAPFLMFDPTWGKVLFEYGVVGFGCYAAMLVQLSRGSTRLVTYPLFLTFLLFGGYLTNASLLVLMLVLVSWRSAHWGPEKNAQAEESSS